MINRIFLSFKKKNPASLFFCFVKRFFSFEGVLGYVPGFRYIGW